MELDVEEEQETLAESGDWQASISRYNRERGDVAQTDQELALMSSDMP